MATVTITTRHRKDGPRYVVRYRLGGRACPIVHAGAFKTMREARARRDLVAGEIAHGRNPADLFDAVARMPVVPAPAVSLTTWGERFLVLADRRR